MRLDVDHECDGQTGVQTDRQTEPLLAIARSKDTR